MWGGSSRPPTDAERANQIAQYLYKKHGATTGEWLTPVAERRHYHQNTVEYEGIERPGSLSVKVQLDTAMVQLAQAMNADYSYYAFSPRGDVVCQDVLDGHFPNINHVRVWVLAQTIECP